MPTQILATGTTATDSADVVVASGATLTVALKDAAGPTVGLGARVYITLKDDAGVYWRVGVLNDARPVVAITPADFAAEQRAGIGLSLWSPM